MAYKRSSRTTVDKAVSLLEAFEGESTASVGLTQLAQRADLSKSTAYRVLSMLIDTGVVERSGTQYRLGRKLHRITEPLSTGTTDMVRDTLTPFLAGLYERTRRTVHLASLDGPNVVYLNKLHGLHAVAAPTRIGARVPAHCTALGKILLAHHPDLAEAILDEELAAWTPHTITNPAQLRRELVRTRSRGFAFDNQESATGLLCVAAAVFAPDGQAVAAMSISGSTAKYDPRVDVAFLRRVCADATRAYVTRAGGRPRPASGDQTYGENKG